MLKSEFDRDVSSGAPLLIESRFSGDIGFVVDSRTALLYDGMTGPTGQQDGVAEAIHDFADKNPSHTGFRQIGTLQLKHEIVPEGTPGAIRLSRPGLSCDGEVAVIFLGFQDESWGWAAVKVFTRSDGEWVTEDYLTGWSWRS